MAFRYQVVRLYPRTRVDLQTLLNQLDSSEVEILTEVRLNKSVEILIPPDSKEDFLGFVEASSMRLETMIPDVQKKVTPFLMSKINFPTTLIYFNCVQ